MDFSYEFLMFQYGNHDTKEKLEYYQSFIMRLLGELKTLRETVCTSCQQKCASSKAVRSGNQSLAAPKLQQRHVEDVLPLRMVETDVFWGTPAPGSISLPINEKIASVSGSLVEIPSERNKLSNESNDRMFYAERDALADPTIDVTFVYSFHHEDRVRCVCFSPDGKYLAVGTGSDDKSGSIVIYEVESRKKYRELREYDTQYGSYTRPFPWKLCFSSEGRYLAVVDEAKRIIIWDVPKKQIRSIFHERSDYIYNVCFSPDGRLVAIWTDGRVVVLNMRDNSRRMASEGGCFDFNPDGRFIVTGHDGVLVMLDVRTGKEVKEWSSVDGAVLHRLKFNSDGRGLSCVYDGMMEQWDMSDAEPVLIRRFEYQTRSHQAISPDHQLLATSDVLLDVHNGKPQYTFKGHKSFIYSVDFNAAGTHLAIGCLDGFVSLWKYARSESAPS